MTPLVHALVVTGVEVCFSEDKQLTRYASGSCIRTVDESRLLFSSSVIEILLKKIK